MRSTSFLAILLLSPLSILARPFQRRAIDAVAEPIVPVHPSLLAKIRNKVAATPPTASKTQGTKPQAGAATESDADIIEHLVNIPPEAVDATYVQQFMNVWRASGGKVSKKLGGWLEGLRERAGWDWEKTNQALDAEKKEFEVTQSRKDSAYKSVQEVKFAQFLENHAPSPPPKLVEEYLENRKQALQEHQNKLKDERTQFLTRQETARAENDAKRQRLEELAETGQSPESSLWRKFSSSSQRLALPPSLKGKDPATPETSSFSQPPDSL